MTGVATTFLATLDVLQRAVASGKNLVITHEPTFYNHFDDTQRFESDEVVAAKRLHQEARNHHLAIPRPLAQTSARWDYPGNDRAIGLGPVL